MSTKEITAQAIALPISDRVMLAQALWASIDAGLQDFDDQETISEARRRDEELSSGTVVGRTHEQVFEAARKAIECI